MVWCVMTDGIFSMLAWLIDWLIGIWVRGLSAPVHLGPLFPNRLSREPGRLAKAPDGPQVLAVNVLWLQKEGAKYACLIEAKASHRQTMWAEVSSAAYFLHSGLSVRPSKWRCLCSVLCPVTNLDCDLLKDNNLTLIPRQGPDISSQACHWELPRFCHRFRCWFPSQRLILFLRSWCWHVWTVYVCGNTFHLKASQQATSSPQGKMPAEKLADVITVM
jgi:hypothetical protein